MPEPVRSHVTYAEYVAFEREATEKHEFLRGEIFAMAGGTPEHAALGAAVIAALTNALRDRHCRVFGPDLRIRIEKTDLATYPDVSVVCGKLELASDDDHAVTNPTVIVEVLSDSTEARDRGDKFAHYRRISSLREYLLVAQNEPRLELYRRTDAGTWELFEAHTGETLVLASIDAHLETDEIYRDPLAPRADSQLTVNGAR